MSLLYGYLVYPWLSRHKPIGIGAGSARADPATIPPDAAERLADTARQLIPHGFIPAGHFTTPDNFEIPGRQAYLAVWLNQGHGVVARALWIRMSASGVRFTMTSYALLFTTTFDDGREIVTHNAPTVPPFPAPGNIDGVAWKDMNHPAMLWKLHRARVRRVQDGRAFVMPTADDAGILALVRDTEQRVNDFAVRRGYLRRDASGEIRKTLRGSYLMTWRLLWPWKQLRMEQQAKKLRRVLSEFPELAAEARALPPSPPAVVESFQAS